MKSIKQIHVVFVLIVQFTVAAWAQPVTYDGTIVDTVKRADTGGNHFYHGANLQPGANIGPGYGVNLSYAILARENLKGAYIQGASLAHANLFTSDLINTDLQFASLSGATLTDADLTGTIFVDGQTVLQHGFAAASQQAYLEASPVAALVASDLIIVPEPATLLLSLAGLALLPHRSRR